MIALWFFTFVCLGISFLLWRYRLQKLLPFPGKPPLPLIGNIHTLAGDFLDALAQFHSYAGEDGISSVFLGPRQTIMVTRHEDVRKALKSLFRQPASDRHSIQFMGERSIVHLTGEEWKLHRRILEKPFHKNFRLMSQHIVDCVDELKQVLLRLEGTEFDIMPVMKAATLEIIALTSFGYKFDNIRNFGISVNSVSRDFEFLLEEKQRRANSFNPFDADYSLPLPANIRHRKAKDNVFSTIRDMIRKRNANPLPEGVPDDFLQMILNSTEKDEQFTEEELADDRHDTTSLSLTFTLWLLSNHPEVERKVLDEIVAVYGDGPISYDHIRELEYMQCVLKEVMRLHPPIPITSRSLDEDTEFRGVVVPKGTFVWIPITEIHKNPHNWDKPEEFRPERFQQEIKPGSWVPFSSGRRNCPGMNFAFLEMKMILAMLLRWFHFRTVPNQEIIPEFVGFVQKPKYGIRMVIEPRVIGN